MKILFYIESLRSGGKERRMVELVKKLSNKRNIDITLVLTKNMIHYKEILLLNNVKICYTLRNQSFKKDPRIFYNFYRIVKDYKPDIIHVWGNLVAIYAIPAKVFLRIPMINNQITDAPNNPTESLIYYKLTFFFSDKIIANTHAGLKSYNASYSKSMVIYNGFDFNRINNLKAKEIVKKDLGILTKFVVGMVASYSINKDYETYIKSANSILEKNENITFLCIGAGNFDNYIKKVNKEYKKRLIFLEEQDDVESIMNICDIGVLMTNTEVHGEGISNALLEFSALGKPIIATKWGGNIELLEDGENGYLVKPKDSDKLTERILYLLNNNKLRNKIGDKAKEIVKEKFNIENMLTSFYKVYFEIFKG